GERNQPRRLKNGVNQHWRDDATRGFGDVSLDRSRNGDATSEAEARILLVEDDATIQNMLADALRENGFSVGIAASGAEMDRAMSREKVDLLLLDLMLPGEDGRSICMRLRAASANLPIIMVTALGDDIDRIVGLEIGADDYVSKPFNTRELIARIRALLRRARANEGAPRPRRAQAHQPAGRARHHHERRVRPAACLLHPRRRSAVARAIAGSHARRRRRAGGTQRRRACEPHPPEDRARRRRSDVHQDDPARRLYLHARGDASMMIAPRRFLPKILPKTAAGQLTSVVVAAVLIGVGLSSAVMFYLVYSGGIGPSHETRVQVRAARIAAVVNGVLEARSLDESTYITKHASGEPVSVTWAKPPSRGDAEPPPKHSMVAAVEEDLQKGWRLQTLPHDYAGDDADAIYIPVKHDEVLRFSVAALCLKERLLLN